MITIDEKREVVTVSGVPMTFAFLECFAQPTPEDGWFRIVRDKDGKLKMEWASEEKLRFTTRGLH